ncbi:MAG: hypothetical protein HYY16_01015, partial [Planctomycetes bacterium]|nr:hypothetical protein [Planctomycetota bacterium]
MKLTDFIARKGIIPALKAKDKRGVIVELAAAMKKAYPEEKFSASDLVDAIMAR